MNSPAEDRNLLFAVLALQADLLTQEQFVEACTLWTTQKEGSLADLLLRRGWLTETDRLDVEKLLERKLKKHAGQVNAALFEATTDQVRQSLVGVGTPVLKTLIAGQPLSEENVLVSTTFQPAEQRDRYTITRLHATGGIGRVWLARDESLGRDVALKEIRPERTSHSSVWSRFLKEAKITGQLEHPGIVPVYELGHSSKDDHPFYTMRFVRGRTYRDAIQIYHQKRKQGELGTLDLRELLTAFIGICNAIAYAHSRGVIHRDLKPANVVLGDYGEVMVLDWGLAKVTGEADEASTEPMVEDVESSVDKTMQGQVLGSPAYMAPEQAEGRLDRIDTRTDIYGLGSILYELLTDQPPFSGTSTLEVLNRVRNFPADRPTQLVASTPKALEAICLKCLSKRSEDRYATVGELTSDVRHFLADEAVMAYREPWSIRLRRWAKRHRVLVTSSFVAMAIAIPILVVGVVLLDQAGDRERRAKELAQANYERALKSADLMAGELARGIRPLAGTQRQTVIGMLDRANAIYNEFLAEANPPISALRNQAATYILFAELYRETNRNQPAHESAEKALAIYDRLLSSPEANREDRIGHAKALHRLAWVLLDEGYDDQSVEQFQKSIAEFEAIGLDDDPHTAGQFLGSAYTMLANQLLCFGDREGARESYRKGLAVREKALQAMPKLPDIRIGYALSLEKYGLFLVVENNKEGVEMVRRAMKEYREVAATDPGNSELHLHYVRSLNSLSSLALDRKEIAEYLDTAESIVNRFAQRDPGHMVWERESLRMAYFRQQKKPRPAESTPESRRKEAEAQQQFLAKFLDSIRRRDREAPENYIWKADYANVLGRLSKAHLDLAVQELDRDANLKRASELARESMEQYQVVMKRSPRNYDNEMGYQYALWVEAKIAEERKDFPEAIRLGCDYSRRRFTVAHGLVKQFNQSESALSEMRKAAVPSWFLIKGIETEYPQAAENPRVVEAALKFLGVITDVPPGASDQVQFIFKRAQTTFAPFGKVLLEKGKLTGEDRQRMEMILKEQ